MRSATNWNLYEYARLLFGIATGAQDLTWRLYQVFSGVKFRFVFHCVDNFVVYSNSFEEHLQHLWKVFHRLHHAGLTVNPAEV
jgi:hypothetical protein